MSSTSPIIRWCLQWCTAATISIIFAHFGKTDKQLVTAVGNHRSQHIHSYREFPQRIQKPKSASQNQTTNAEEHEVNMIVREEQTFHTIEYNKIIIRIHHYHKSSRIYKIPSTET